MQAGLEKAINEMYEPAIIKNWQIFVDKRIKTKNEQKNLYGLIYNVLNIVEFERLRKESLKNPVEKLELDDFTLQTWMDYSKYTPQTGLSEPGIDVKRIPELWTKRFRDTNIEYFPVYTNELNRIKNFGKLIHEIYKKIKSDL